MNSAELFETRVRKYQKKSMKYMRYVLNDHFLIVLFFLFGFIMVQYSSWIQTIRVLELPLLALLGALLASVPFFGGLATLLEPADGIFLSIVGQDFKAYLQKAIRRSWMLPLLVMLASTGIIFPIVAQAFGTNLSMFVKLFLLQVFFKDLLFRCTKYAYRGVLHFTWMEKLGIYMIAVTNFFGMFLWISEGWSIVLLVVPVLLSIFVEQYYGKAAFMYQFDKMIEMELERQQRIYRLFALFVDVPMLHKPHAHRRTYLDGVLKMLVGNQPSGHRYLVSRTVIRTSQYMSLLLQLAVVGFVVALFSQPYYWNFIVNALLMMLLGFQLVGVIQSANTQNSHFASLVDSNTRLQDDLSVLMLTMVVSGIVIGISSAIGMRELIGLVGIVFYPIFGILFTQFYLRYRFLKKRRKI
ncbi:ABC transporter permease [uncultured Granulicatella sp.]|uniref:ABC transporter permease n=1 Tax=uncultured Granulicatella sp. TaxID=316089 RepID=UPI002601CBD4|nr:ABC transporter permease [uncultured Granulicatella sp.]